GISRRRVGHCRSPGRVSNVHVGPTSGIDGGDGHQLHSRGAEGPLSDFAELVGERLMIGLPGPSLRDEDLALFRDTRAAGLSRYRRDFESPEPLHSLLTGLESALGRRLLAATDHEGGRVVMLGRGTTIFPDNLAVGMAGEEAFAARQGLFEAREL